MWASTVQIASNILHTFENFWPNCPTGEADPQLFGKETQQNHHYPGVCHCVTKEELKLTGKIRSSSNVGEGDTSLLTLWFAQLLVTGTNRKARFEEKIQMMSLFWLKSACKHSHWLWYVSLFFFMSNLSISGLYHFHFRGNGRISLSGRKLKVSFLFNLIDGEFESFHMLWV